MPVLRQAPAAELLCREKPACVQDRQAQAKLTSLLGVFVVLGLLRPRRSFGGGAQISLPAKTLS